MAGCPPRSTPALLLSADGPSVRGDPTPPPQRSRVEHRNGRWTSPTSRSRPVAPLGLRSVQSREDVPAKPDAWRSRTQQGADSWQFGEDCVFFTPKRACNRPANGLPVTYGASKPHLATTHQVPDGVGPQSVALAFVWGQTSAASPSRSTTLLGPLLCIEAVVRREILRGRCRRRTSSRRT